MVNAIKEPSKPAVFEVTVLEPAVVNVNDNSGTLVLSTVAVAAFDKKKLPLPL